MTPDLMRLTASSKSQPGGAILAGTARPCRTGPASFIDEVGPIVSIKVAPNQVVKSSHASRVPEVPGPGRAGEDGRETVLYANHQRHWASWPAKLKLVGDVRGRGLMIGVDIVKDKATKEYAAAERDLIVEKAFANMACCSWAASRARFGYARRWW
jgi:hypothetical protein